VPEPRAVTKTIEALARLGATGPGLVPPQQRGLGSIEAHNQAVAALEADLASLQTIRTTLAEALDSHLQAVREQETWLENRRLELEARSQQTTGVVLEYPTEPALDLLSEVSQPYLTKELKNLWGRTVTTSGPWQLVASEPGGAPYEMSVAGRWRVTFEHQVTVSEIRFAVAPEQLRVFNVVRATVTAVSGATVTLSGINTTATEIPVDVLSGPSEGAWFLGTLVGDQLGGLGAELAVGDDLELGLRCGAYGIGGGAYEVERLNAPIRTIALDLIVGSPRQLAWLGLPRADCALKVYAPVSELRSLPGPEPKRAVTLHCNASLPAGSYLEHFLVSGGIFYPIDVEEETSLREIIPLQQVRETVTLGRDRTARLSWSAYVSEQELVDNQYGFDPNLSGARGVSTLAETFGTTREIYGDKLRRWNLVGPESLTGSGLEWDGLSWAGATLAAEKTQVQLTGSLLAKAQYGQPYGAHYQWTAGFVSCPTLGTLAANSMFEARLRMDHLGEGLAVRALSTTGTLTQLGLYHYHGATAVTLASTSFTAATLWHQWTVTLGDDSVTLAVVPLGTTVTAASLTATGLTMPGGPGLSFHMWAGTLALSTIDVRSNLPHLSPVRVTVLSEGVRIPPDKAGSTLEDIVPRYETVRILPDASLSGVYRLPYPPVRRLYESELRMANAEAPLRVVEWVEADQSEGDPITDFEIDVKNSLLRIRDQRRSGPIQVSYWTMRRKDIDVPITRNVTDYLGLGSTLALRPALLAIDNRDYYPIVEYRHEGNTLTFAEDWGDIEVEYDSYAVRLDVTTRFVRGYNPCRSPRILKATWELS
jgi:hypothetical protein